MALALYMAAAPSGTGPMGPWALYKGGPIVPLYGDSLGPYYVPYWAPSKDALGILVGDDSFTKGLVSAVPLGKLVISDMRCEDGPGGCLWTAGTVDGQKCGATGANRDQ